MAFTSEIHLWIWYGYILFLLLLLTLYGVFIINCVIVNGRFFSELPLREGPPLISVFFNSLYDPFGSPCRGQKRCSNRFAIRLADHQRQFLKSTRPSLPLKKVPPLSPSPFPQAPFPSGYRGCTNRPTRCSNRFAIWLADHQRSTPAAELRFSVRG